ncbi:MAG TPA: helix-turn-helix domain-containing protein [Cellulomonas sp.]
MAVVSIEHRTVSPCPASAGIAERLWVLRAPDGVGPRVALPDGRGAVVVHLGAPATWLDPLTRTATEVRAVVRGPRSTPTLVVRPGPVWTVGARLTPAALARLGEGAFLVDDARPVGEVLGRAEDVLTAALRACWAEPEPGARDDDAGGEPALAAARLLEQALLGAVRRTVTAERQADLDRLFQVAEQERGLVRPIDLARAIDRSLACLHQIFAEEVGLTPSAYLAGVRLSAAVRELGAGDPDADAAQVVATLRRYADAGFSPREVERFTGLAPLELRRSVRGLEELLAAGTPVG